METLSKLTEREKLILETELDVYRKIKRKIQDISDGEIEPEYYILEIEREMDNITEKLKEPKPVPVKIEVLAPEYGPGDKVSHRVTDTPMLFTVMEVNHSTKEYKLTSNNQIKPVTIMIGWGELDEN